MNINQTTKYDIGQTVYFVKQSTSYEEIPCTHCGGNYREIVNNIEYKCPYCKGGRESRRVDHYELKSGVITNIHIAVNGIDERTDHITGDKIKTNIRYCVTENHTEGLFDVDGSSINKYEGELYASADGGGGYNQRKMQNYHTRRQFMNNQTPATREAYGIMPRIVNIGNPIYQPTRSQVIKNKRRKAHLQRTKRR